MTDSIASELANRGIDTSQPGFYDSVEFRKCEARNPRFLEMYALFIREQSYTKDYLHRAARVARSATAFLHKRLRDENRLGACIDASMVLIRFLERQAVWCYASKGCLTVFYPTSLKQLPHRLGSIMMPGNPAKAGHVWVVAPPFYIVDVSISLQANLITANGIVPDCIFADAVRPAQPEPFDIADPDVVEHFAKTTGLPPTMADLEGMSPGLQESIAVHGAYEYVHGETIFRYIAHGVTAPEEPFEDYNNLILDSKKPSELYDEWIKDAGDDLA